LLWRHGLARHGSSTGSTTAGCTSTGTSSTTLVLWGERGVVHEMFQPVQLWQAECVGIVTGQAMAAGHFIPEELPLQSADALRDFFMPGPRRVAVDPSQDFRR